jgi:hypothetical protein
MKTEEMPFQISRRDEQAIVDVYGPYIQFLTSLEKNDSELCFLKGVIPPGVSIPLHSHAEEERSRIQLGNGEGERLCGDSRRNSAQPSQPVESTGACSGADDRASGKILSGNWQAAFL